MVVTTTTRFSLGVHDIGTLDPDAIYQTLLDNNDTIDENLALVLASGSDTVAGTLDNKVDDVTVDVDSSSQKLYHRHSRLLHDMASDADYTIASPSHRHAVIAIDDSGTLLTASRNIILPAEVRLWIAENLTAQSLTFKTASGAGVAIPANNRQLICCNGTDVLALSGSSPAAGSSFDQPKLNAAITSATSSRTLTLSEHSAYLFVSSASAITITLPEDATENLPIGFQCTIIREGAGTVGFAVEGSDTLNSAGSLTNIASQNAAVVAVKRASGLWWLFGDLG